jgi:drug/metabolite transporter (DMT)-like permease
MPTTSARRGIVFAIGSAILFAISTPLAKPLLREGLSPQLLAGLFYLGSGVGLSALTLIRSSLGQAGGEAPLRGADVPRLAVAILLGGALAPALLLLGLARTPASTAALLLNLEGIATMVIAWVIFHENVDRRLIVGAISISAGAALLSWSGVGVAPAGGSLLIIGACLAWGIDNNVTRTLSNADPMQIALTKGLVAGGANLALALAMGARLPAWPTALYAAALGFFGYGVSLVLFVHALRLLGAARTSAYFSTAPFIGALLAVALLSEAITLRLVAAGLLMAAGVYLHLRESHDHSHAHESLEHEHLHVHDAHHHHEHALTEDAEPHSHRHRHSPLVHTHPHYPDLHHRHHHRIKS